MVAAVADSVPEGTISDCYKITYMTSAQAITIIASLFPNGNPIDAIGGPWTRQAGFVAI